MDTRPVHLNLYSVTWSFSELSFLILGIKKGSVGSVSRKRRGTIMSLFCGGRVLRGSMISYLVGCCCCVCGAVDVSVHGIT